MTHRHTRKPRLLRPLTPRAAYPGPARTLALPVLRPSIPEIANPRPDTALPVSGPKESRPWT